MGAVPESYYEFVMHYAPHFYVIPTAITVDAVADQKNVTVADGTKFQAGFPVEIKDEARAEWNEVDTVLGNVVTMKTNLTNTYHVSKSGKVEGADPAFMRGAFPTAFAIEFLYEAYSAAQFASRQAAIRARKAHSKMQGQSFWKRCKSKDSLLTRHINSLPIALFSGNRLRPKRSLRLRRLSPRLNGALSCRSLGTHHSG